MREIKFRAWHKPTKQMCCVEGMSFGGILNLDRKVINNPCRDALENTCNDAQDYDCEITQYIGHKDKRGVEMYQHDIIRRVNMLGLWTIDWWVPSASFALISSDCQIRLGIVDEGSVEEFVTFKKWRECEVIGNIYENPELLKEGK